jgi:hypothetical protein
MKRTQTCVLRREASSTRNVYDQANLIYVQIKRDCFARDRFHAEVSEGRHPFTVAQRHRNDGFGAETVATCCLPRVGYKYEGECKSS